MLSLPVFCDGTSTPLLWTEMHFVCVEVAFQCKLGALKAGEYHSARLQRLFVPDSMYLTVHTNTATHDTTLTRGLVKYRLQYCSTGTESLWQFLMTRSVNSH